MAPKINKYFRKEDVNVRFPKPTSTIVARRGNLPVPAPRPKTKSNFRLIRIVMNLELVDATKPGMKILSFKPPVEFHVRYKEDDLRKAGKRELCLGYWDDKRKDWIPLTSPNNNSRLKWDPIKKRGLIKVDIYNWGDPPIGIGT